MPAAKRDAQAKQCELAVLGDSLMQCQREATHALEQAKATLAQQLSALTDRHEACLRDYSHSFSKQVRCT